MKNNQPSDTYKKLYYQIIDELLAQICNNNINYSVKCQVNGEPVPIAIYHKFEEYKNKAIKNMSSRRLDRHKLASCICGAIIEVKPLTGYNNAIILKKANEIFALYVGLNIIKAYMLYDLLKVSNMSPIKIKKIDYYLKNNFDMKFPENICDTQHYKDNFANALYWSHYNCNITKKECFNYDIWAYSKIYYHLELYNKEHIKKCYEDCINQLM